MYRRNFLTAAATLPMLRLPQVQTTDIRCIGYDLAPESIMAACRVADFLAEFELHGMETAKKLGDPYTHELQIPSNKWDINSFVQHIPDRLAMQAMYYCHPDPAESRRRYDGIWKWNFDLWFPGWSDDECCWFAFFGIRDIVNQLG